MSLIAASLAFVAGQLQGSRHRATARLVVEDPTRSTDVISAAVSPDRYVQEQVAVFDLPTLHELGAAIVNDAIELDTGVRTAAASYVGPDGRVTVGSEGSIQLGQVGAELLHQPDGSVRTGATVGVVIDADGSVRRGDRTQVLDAGGDSLVVAESDVVVIRSDGLVLISSDGTGREQPILLDANGAVVEDISQASVPGLVAHSDGSIRVSYGLRQLRIGAEGGGAQLLDRDGEVLVRPDGGRDVGADARLFLLDNADAGTAVAISEEDLTIVDTAGVVVVADTTGTIIARAAGASVVESTADGGLLFEGVRYDATTFADGLVVTERPNTNMLEVTFLADQPDLARLGANAAAEAYRKLKASDSSGARSEALARADASLAAVTGELARSEAALAEALVGQPGRAELTEQYDDIVSALATAGRALLASPSNSDAVAQRIAALQLQLDAIRNVGETDLSRPDVAELVSARDLARTRLGQIQAERDSILVGAESSATGISLLSPATESVPAGGFGGAQLVIVGLLAGLFAAAFVAYLLDSHLGSVDTADEVGAVLRVPMLGEIPDYRHERIDGGTPVVARPESFVAEAYRIAAAAVALNDLRGGAPKLLGVVSAGVAAGKTSVVANLSVALAQGQRSVLAADADLEGQALTAILGRLLEDEPRPSGISDILAGDASLDDSTDRVSIDGEGSLELLSGGTMLRRGRSLFDSLGSDELFRALPNLFDTILVDLPPLLNVGYAGSILRQLEGVIVVVRRGGRRRDLQELADRLELIGRPIVGFVMTATPLRPERTVSVAALGHENGDRARQWRPSARMKRGRTVRSS